MFTNRVVFSTAFLISLATSGPVFAGEACGVKDPVASINMIYWKSDKGTLIPLKIKNGDTYEFPRVRFSSAQKRYLRFVGYFRTFDKNVPVAIKISAWSKDARRNTRRISLHRPKMGRLKRFSDTSYSLRAYHRHHFPKNKSNDWKLRKQFHFEYKDSNGVPRRTDDTDEKRITFLHEGVPDTYSGLYETAFEHVSSIIIGPALATAEKYVYLKTILRNLRRSPCFTFSVSVPGNAHRILLSVAPVDGVRRARFGRSRWRLENFE